MRIVQKLNDCGVKRRLTQIALDSAKDELTVVSVGSDVWQRYFSFNDGTWFAAVYGDNNDNFLAISISREWLPKVDIVIRSFGRYILHSHG